MACSRLHQLQIYKTQIKLWEVEFETSKGQKPEKDDIKCAPDDIRRAYKQYWKLKTQRSQSLEPSLHSDDSIASVDLDSSQDDQTWGTHLNRPKTEQPRTQDEPKGSKKEAITTPVTSKMFTGAKFSRKSLPRSMSFTRQKSASPESAAAVQNDADTLLTTNSTPTSEPSNDSPMGLIDFNDSQSNSTDVSDFNGSVGNANTRSRCFNDLTSNLAGDDNVSGDIVDLKCLKSKIAFTANKVTWHQPVSAISQRTQSGLTSRVLDHGWLERRTSQNSLGSDGNSENTGDSDCASPGVVDPGSPEEDDDIENQPLITRLRKRKAEQEVYDVAKKIRLEDVDHAITAPTPKSLTPAPKSLPPVPPPAPPPGAVQKKSKAQILEEKVSSGRANDNFVRINLKKKVYVRGKRKFSAVHYKRAKWKQRMSAAAHDSEESPALKIRTCYKCGDIGHFAKQCSKGLGNEVDEPEEDTSPFPTLEEAAAITWNCKKKPDVAEDVPAIGTAPEKPSARPTVPPLYELEDGQIIATPTEVHSALHEFGHSLFQPGQEEACMRILSGRSTLLVLPTGSGKSLCYQLPAYLYYKLHGNCITLVVSPLVSLMEDQVTGLPKCLKAACLHSGQTKVQRDKVEMQLAAGKLHVLLVSPEAVMSRGKGLDKLPPIAFACVDEAHCISVWSHNFRPSYLQLCRALKDRMGVSTILAMTATATRTTVKGVVEQLQISSHDAIVRGSVLPKNLILSTSVDERREDALVELLRTEPYSTYESIVVYCTRREQCERLATLIRTCLVKAPSKGGVAEAYHAGLSAPKRRAIQNRFMSGKLRIVVATVAFGMGLDKSDVRSVIHYNMPKSFEGYVQEVGRSGRDGQPANCHLFLAPKGDDLPELRRHIYANVVDRPTIRRLLDRVFKRRCKCEQGCKGHEVAFGVEDSVQQLDLPEENLATLLCYLEMHPKGWVKVMSNAYQTCTVRCYGGPGELKCAARKCAPLGVAVALASKRGKSHEGSSTISFPVVEVASSMGWDSSVAKQELKGLEWDQRRKSGINVELKDVAFRLKVSGNLSESELDQALEFLHGATEKQVRRELFQLERIFYCFSTAALEKDSAAMNKKLRASIANYFDSSTDEHVPELPADILCPNEEQIRSDVCNLVNIHRDHNFTGRAVARIFHGIASPCFPADVWGRVRRFWRAHLNTDFYQLCRLATQEIVRMRAPF